MKNLNRFVLTRVILAITIAVLVVLMKKEMIWGGFKILLFPKPVFRLWIAFMVLLLLSALWRVFLEMYRRGAVPNVQRFLDSRMKPTQERIQDLLQRVLLKMSVQFLLWGSLIALILLFVWNQNSLDDSKLNELRQLPIPGVEVKPPADSPAAVFPLTVFQTTQEDFLRNALTIVDDLKKAKVKAVLVPFDYVYGYRRDIQIELIKKLNETGIVVFGSPTNTDYQFGDAKTGEIYKYRGGYFTVLGEEYPWYSPIRKIEPISTRSIFSLRKDPPYDVTFELLRLYYGMPDNEAVKREGSEVVFGDLRFPVDEAGSLYVGRLVNTGTTGSWRYLWPRISAAFDPEKGVTYYKLELPGRLTQLGTLQDESTAFEGKIVILDWMFGLNYGRGRSETYAQILHHMIRGETLTRSRSMSLMAAILVIIVCGVIMRRSTPLTAVALVVILFWLIALWSAWLFQVSAIVVYPVYAVAGMALSIVVFSVIRMAQGWRLSGNLGVSAGASPPHRRIAVDSAGPAIGLALLRTRISFSPAEAFSILVLVVVITALVVGSVGQQKPIESSREVVYVTSLPTVEVQGVYIPNKEIKQ